MYIKINTSIRNGYNENHYPFYQVFSLLLVLSMGITGCNTLSGYTSGGSQANMVLYVAADFGPSGRLWRLTPYANAIKVDYSEDLGKTFSEPVKVNSMPQAIQAWKEEPPVIRVDRQGRIHVLYVAKENGRNTTWFSTSADGGNHFSEPINLRTRTAEASHYLDVMAIDSTGRAHVVWHDERDSEQYEAQGSGVLSLYYASIQDPQQAEFRSRKIAGSLCSCCRTTIDIDTDDQPVVLGRFVFDGGARDHAILKIPTDGKPDSLRRISNDNWQIDGCPSQGPALSIAEDGRYHVAWFMQGSERQGLFYAHSADSGPRISEPMPVGHREALPKHPDVLALGNDVVLAWKEFDGTQTKVRSMVSLDRGETWSTPKTLTASKAASIRPELITDGKAIYLSWNSADQEYQLIPIKRSDSKHQHG